MNELFYIVHHCQLRADQKSPSAEYVKGFLDYKLAKKSLLEPIAWSQELGTLESEQITETTIIMSGIHAQTHVSTIYQTELITIPIFITERSNYNAQANEVYLTGSLMVDKEDRMTDTQHIFFDQELASNLLNEWLSQEQSNPDTLNCFKEDIGDFFYHIEYKATSPNQYQILILDKIKVFHG